MRYDTFGGKLGKIANRPELTVGVVDILYFVLTVALDRTSIGNITKNVQPSHKEGWFGKKKRNG